MPKRRNPGLEKAHAIQRERKEKNERLKELKLSMFSEPRLQQAPNFHYQLFRAV